MELKKFTDLEIANALIYCRVSTRITCHLCAYNQIAGGKCSKKLLTDASERITELVEENRKLKEKEK